MIFGEFGGGPRGFESGNFMISLPQLSLHWQAETCFCCDIVFFPLGVASEGYAEPILASGVKIKIQFCCPAVFTILENSVCGTGSP